MNDESLIWESYLILLHERVGGNYLFHTPSHVKNIESIISTGKLYSNKLNKLRTNSDLNSISFSRNWRYVFSMKDDDGGEIGGLYPCGFAFVFDRNIITNRLKIKKVTNKELSQAIKKYFAMNKEELDKGLNSFNFTEFEGLLIPEMWKDPAAIDIFEKNSSKFYNYVNLPETQKSTKLAFICIYNLYNKSSKSEQDFQLYKRRLQLLQTYISKKTPTKMQQNLEYEEVVLTSKDSIVLERLGFIGYIFDNYYHPLPEKQKQQIREMISVKYPNAKDLTDEITGRMNIKTKKY